MQATKVDKRRDMTCEYICVSVTNPVKSHCCHYVCGQHWAASTALFSVDKVKANRELVAVFECFVELN